MQSRELLLKNSFTRMEVIAPVRKKISIPTDQGVFVVPKNQIKYIKARGNYCEIHYGLDKMILWSKTTKHIASKLRDKGFVRIHQSYIINIDFLSHISKDYTHLTLVDDVILPVSRRKKSLIKQSLLRHFD